MTFCLNSSGRPGETRLTAVLAGCLALLGVRQTWCLMWQQTLKSRKHFLTNQPSYSLLAHLLRHCMIHWHTDRKFQTISPSCPCPLPRRTHLTQHVLALADCPLVSDHASLTQSIGPNLPFNLIWTFIVT